MPTMARTEQHRYANRLMVICGNDSGNLCKEGRKQRRCGEFSVCRKEKMEGGQVRSLKFQTGSTTDYIQRFEPII